MSVHQNVQADEYKRDIREDIAEIAGIQDLASYEQYEPPETGDRKFTTSHIGYILQYLDVKKPRAFKRYKYHNKLARVIENRTGFSIDRADTSNQYSGLKKAELEVLRDVVEDHEPLGLPTREEIADEVQNQYPDVDRDEAERAADQLLSHLERQRGPEDLRHGFTAQDVVARRKVRLTIEREED